MGSKKEIVRATIIISAISALPAIVNFLLLPLFTSFFDRAAYGYFSILNNISLFFSIISGLNIASAIAAYYKSYKEGDSLQLFIGNAISFSLIFNTALLCLVSLAGNLFSGFIFKEQVSYFPDLFLAVATGLYGNIFLVFTYYLRYDKQVRYFALLSICQVIVLAGLQVISLVFLKRGVTGVLMARLLSAAIMFLVIMVIHRKYIFTAIRFDVNLRKPLKYSLLTCPALLITWMTTYGDRFVMEHFLDLKRVGEYSFLATICSVTELAIFAFNSALQPYIFDRFAENKSTARNFYRLFIFLSILTISALIILGSNIDIIVKNKEFLAIIPFMIPMMTGFIFSAVSNLFALQITFSQKGSYYLVISVLAFAANLTLNFLLIPGNGVAGAVLANIFTKLIVAFTVIYFSQRAMRLDNLREIMAIVGVFILVEVAAWSIARSGFFSFKLMSLMQLLVLVLLGGLIYRERLIRNLRLLNVLR